MRAKVTKVEQEPEATKEIVEQKAPMMWLEKVVKMRTLFRVNADMREQIFDALYYDINSYSDFIKIVGAYQITRKADPNRFTGEFEMLQFENEHLAKIVNLIDEKRGAAEGLLSCQSANDVLAYIETHSKSEVE